MAPTCVLPQLIPLGVGLSALREGAGPRLRVARREDRREGLRAGGAGHAPPSSCGADHVGWARAAHARLGIERASVGRAYWAALHVQVLAAGVILGLGFGHQGEEQVVAHQLLQVCVLEVDRRDEGLRLGGGDLLGDGRGRLGEGDDDLVGLSGRTRLGVRLACTKVVRSACGFAGPRVRAACGGGLGREVVRRML